MIKVLNKDHTPKIVAILKDNYEKIDRLRDCGTFSEESVEKVLSTFLTNDLAIAYGDFDGHEIVALGGIFINPNLMNLNEYTAHEFMFNGNLNYKPERQMLSLYRVLERLKLWASKFGVNEFVIGDFTENKYKKLYEKCGFRHTQNFYKIKFNEGSN